MRENAEKVKDLEDYLVKIQRSADSDKLSKRIKVLINYYKGVSNKVNAGEYKISERTINRWVNKYESGNRYTIISDEHNGRTPKIEDKQKDKIEKDLEKNPLKLGLNYSIWNGTLLKRYIKDKLDIELSKIYCEKLLNASNTIYKASNYDAKKSPKLVNNIKDLINEYENNKNYSVWYFDTYYLGRNVIKEMKPKYIDEIKSKAEEIEEMLRGNADNEYRRYNVYGFFNIKEPLEYDIKNNINKENFIGILKEFVDGKKQELKEDIKLLIVLPSNNIFKTIINEEKLFKDIEVKIFFIPKNLIKANKINAVWDKIHKNNFSIKGKLRKEIHNEFESFIDKIFWE